MPFEAVEYQTRANAPPTALISYMRPQKNKTGKSKPRLIITLPTTICGVSKSETFVLLVGTGTDAGKLRIKGAAKKTDGVKPTQMLHAFKFNFGFVPALGEEIFDGQRQPLTKINDEEFEITVPASWFDGSAE